INPHVAHTIIVTYTRMLLLPSDLHARSNPETPHAYLRPPPPLPRRATRGRRGRRGARARRYSRVHDLIHRLASDGGGSITDSPRLRLRLAPRPRVVQRYARPFHRRSSSTARP